MGADCLGGAWRMRDAVAKDTGAMPLDKKFDGSNLNDKQFEGPKAPNVEKR